MILLFEFINTKRLKGGGENIPSEFHGFANNILDKPSINSLLNFMMYHFRHGMNYLNFFSLHLSSKNNTKMLLRLKGLPLRTG